MLTQKLLTISLLGTEWVVYFLLLLSVFSMTLIVERFLYLRMKKGDLKKLEAKVHRDSETSHADKVKKILHKDHSSPSSVAVATYKNVHDQHLDFEEGLAIALSEERLLLENRIVFLGTIGSTSPFLGLFGTVLGIMNAFHGLAQTNQGGSQVMAGISEALVATALGLLVAIPAVTAYNHFMREIKGIMVTAENFTRSFMLANVRHKVKAH